jgi:hypothetical protein
MSFPDVEVLELLHETYWGQRNTFRKLCSVRAGRIPRAGSDPYDLTKYCVDKDGKDACRFLELPGIRLFPLLRPSSKILLRSEYVYIYERLLSIFESDFETCGGAVVTGYSGIGNTLQSLCS